MDGIALWQERFDRIKKTINLEPVDQVPVVMGAATTGAGCSSPPLVVSTTVTGAPTSRVVQASVSVDSV